MSRRQPAEWAHAAALGDRISILRKARIWPRTELARRAAEHGIVWHNGAVREIEEGTRLVTAYELTVIPSLLNVSLVELLDGLPKGGPARLNHADEGLSRAAQRLGVTVDELEQAAHRLWGRTLYAEREARLGALDDHRTNQARRGHVTRALLNELRRALATA